MGKIVGVISVAVIGLFSGYYFLMIGHRVSDFELPAQIGGVEIRWHGGSASTQKKIQSSVFSNKNGIELRFRTSRLEAEIMNSAMVSQAKVAPCSFLSVRCYDVFIEERTPFFLGVLSNRSSAWLFDNTGNFIAPVSQSQFRRGYLDDPHNSFSKLTTVFGLWAGSASAEVVKVRAQQFSLIIEEVKNEVGQAPVELSFNGNEVELKFDQYKFPVIFGLRNERAGYREQSRKLSLLLHKLSKDDKLAIRQIDLSGAKVAVVRLTKTSEG